MCVQVNLKQVRVHSVYGSCLPFSQVAVDAGQLTDDAHELFKWVERGLIS